MSEEDENSKSPPPKNLLLRFDVVVKKFIPNFNARAIVYFSLLFAVAMYLQIWSIASPAPKQPQPKGKQETVIADDTYWQSKLYKEKVQNQTVESFTAEFAQWLSGQSQEFSRRRFEDMLFINNGLTSETGQDLTMIVPENFNYLENQARARYQYAKSNGFLSEAPTLISHGTLVCDLGPTTEKATGIQLYEWRYASMSKLAEFMNTKPTWKIQVGDKIFDVSDPRIEDKDILKLKNAQSQPAGLFSFLVFRDPSNNRIFLADSTILENNGVDAAVTLSKISSHAGNLPKLYFKAGFEGCKQINNVPQTNYGQSN